jgi:nitrogen regulatory protein PII
MSIEPMTMVTAHIRQNREQCVVDALHALPGFPGSSATDSAEKMCDTIAKAARTGGDCDGVIFIAPLPGLLDTRELGTKERRVQ